MPDVKEVSAKSPKLKRETVIMVDYGKDVDESIEMFGGDAVNSNALANWNGCCCFWWESRSYSGFSC